MDTDAGRSLMKIKKSSGPKILPCGTPETTGNGVDTLPFIDTYWCLCVRYDFNQLQTLPLTPEERNLNNSSLWTTLSRAFLISRYTTSDSVWAFFKINGGVNILKENEYLLQSWMFYVHTKWFLTPLAKNALHSPCIYTKCIFVLTR